MTALHGKSGNIKLATVTVAELDTWSLDVDRDISDVTKFATGGVAWKSFIAGLAGASGKLDGRLDMTDTSGQFALWTSMVSDTPLALSLYLDATHNFAVNIFITKMSDKVAVDKEETVSFSFTVTGAPVYS